MEVKFINNPITIKTIEIDGKKMTKQLIQQIELEYYTFVDYAGKVYKMREVDTLIKNQLEDLKLACNVIGWINLHFEKDEYVTSWVGLGITKFGKYNIKTILFTNDKGELKRGYITNNYFEIFCKNIPHIFI